MEKVLVTIIIDQSSGSLSVINHNRQAHQEEEDSASNCEMMKGSSRNELTHYWKFSFHFHPESDAFCCCCSTFKAPPDFTRPCGCSARRSDEQRDAESPWIHSSLHLFIWPWCSPHQTPVDNTPISWNKPDMTSQFIRFSVNCSTWTRTLQEVSTQDREKLLSTTWLKQGLKVTKRSWK